MRPLAPRITRWVASMMLTPTAWSFTRLPITLTGLKDTGTVNVPACKQRTSVVPVLPTATEPTCDTDGVLSTPEQPEGVTATVDHEGTGPGTYTFTFTADEGYVLAEGVEATFTITVEAATGDCETTPPPTTPPTTEPDTRRQPPPRRCGGNNNGYASEHSAEASAKHWCWRFPGPRNWAGASGCGWYFCPDVHA